MIEKGHDWGVPGHLHDDSPVFEHDHELAAYLENAYLEKDSPRSPAPRSPAPRSAAPRSAALRSAALRSGDLARTLGLRADHDPARARFLVPVDAIHVQLDERPARLAMAHVIVGWFRAMGETVAVMNAAFFGDLNVAPRAHPGDGKLEVVTI